MLEKRRKQLYSLERRMWLLMNYSHYMGHHREYELLRDILFDKIDMTKAKAWMKKYE